MTNPAMHRRSFLKTGAAAAAAGLPFVASGAPSVRRGRTPNVLFIITDQQHIDTISAAGCEHIRTPAMDRLVREGTCFTQSYSANPLCSPARSSMFTGRPTTETGVYRNGLPIRRGMPNLGEWLRQESDYETVYSGKWHVPRGFTHFIPGFRVINTGIGGQGNLGDAATSRACEAYLHNRDPSRPFFMVASFLQPHDICEWLRLNSGHLHELPFPELADRLPPLPANFRYDPREPDAVRTRREGNEGLANDWTEEHWRYYIWSYYRHVEMVDAEIGRVLRALDHTGAARNTLVVFTADHGEGTGHHQNTRKNNLYDEGVKVPFVARWPGHVAEGRCDRETLVSGLDVLPTVCDYAGVALPPDVRGVNLRPALEADGGGLREFCVSEVSSNRGRMVRSGRYKYVAYAGDPVEQLFDVEADPGEMVNLAPDAAHADALRTHRALLLDWERRLDPAPTVPRSERWRG